VYHVYDFHNNNSLVRSHSTMDIRM